MSTSDYTDNLPNPTETQAQILSPITQALTRHNLTIDRLCKDLDDVITTTSDNPNAKLKGVDMGFKLQQAYPAERSQVDTTLTIKDVSSELKTKIKANIKGQDV